MGRTHRPIRFLRPESYSLKGINEHKNNYNCGISLKFSLEILQFEFDLPDLAIHS